MFHLAHATVLASSPIEMALFASYINILYVCQNHMLTTRSDGCELCTLMPSSSICSAISILTICKYPLHTTPFQRRAVTVYLWKKISPFELLTPSSSRNAGDAKLMMQTRNWIPRSTPLHASDLNSTPQFHLAMHYNHSRRIPPVLIQIITWVVS